MDKNSKKALLFKIISIFRVMETDLEIRVNELQEFGTRTYAMIVEEIGMFVLLFF